MNVITASLPGVGQYAASGQCSDLVLVSLDMILKKYAEKRPLVFNSKHVNVIEQFFFKRRPMSANIAFDILTTLADKRPELFEKKRRKYAQVSALRRL